jgi:hypothetical protein
MVRRLLALVPVLVVVGCVGGSHEGHGGVSRTQSPLSAPSPAVASSAARPGQLHGVPLTGATGLVLLISADPPYLLDVDTGRVTPVKGLGVHRPAPVLSVLAAGRDAVVWIDRRPLASGLPDEDIYLVRRGDATATRIAAGSDVQSAAGGRSVWVKSFIDAHHCTVQEIDLAGRHLRGPRPVPCSAALIDPGAGPARSVARRGGRRPEREADRVELLRPRIPGHWRTGHRRLAARSRHRPLAAPTRHAGRRRAEIHEHVLDQRRPSGDARADAHRRPGQPRRHHGLAARPEKPRDPIRAHTGSRQRQRQLHSLAQRPDGTSRVLVGLVRTTPPATQAE